MAMIRCRSLAPLSRNEVKESPPCRFQSYSHCRPFKDDGGDEIGASIYRPAVDINIDEFGFEDASTASGNSGDRLNISPRHSMSTRESVKWDIPPRTTCFFDTLATGTPTPKRIEHYFAEERPRDQGTKPSFYKRIIQCLTG